MFIVQSYPLAIFFCFVTMLCWGSWGNTQKLAAKTWRYELFYWDYVIGLLLFSLLSAFTLGSFGTEGRSFLDDLMQADGRNLFSAFLGGVVFNASNILLAAAVALCGMSVAFPVGVGLALVLGVLINYFGAAKGDPLFIFLGVALIAAAIVMNGMVHILSELVLRELLVRELLETESPVRPAEKPLSPCPVEYVRNLPDRIGVDRSFLVSEPFEYWKRF